MSSLGLCLLGNEKSLSSSVSQPDENVRKGNMKRRLYTRKKSRGKWENPFPSSELPPVQTKSKRKPKAAVASPPLPPKPPLLEKQDHTQETF